MRRVPETRDAGKVLNVGQAISLPEWERVDSYVSDCLRLGHFVNLLQHNLPTSERARCGFSGSKLCEFESLLN